MKKLTLVSVFLFASATGVFAQGAGKVQMRDFSFMAGCWERRDDFKRRVISEQWMSLEGTSIIGMSRTVHDFKTTDWEFMRIEQRTDGIYFVAKPKANATETDFKLVRWANGEFVFENADHDFPQRVIYKADGKRLKGRIEGTFKGKPAALDFPMTRVKCA